MLDLRTKTQQDMCLKGIGLRVFIDRSRFNSQTHLEGLMNLSMKQHACTFDNHN